MLLPKDQWGEEIMYHKAHSLGNCPIHFRGGDPSWCWYTGLPHQVIQNTSDATAVQSLQASEHFQTLLEHASSHIWRSSFGHHHGFHYLWVFVGANPDRYRDQTVFSFIVSEYILILLTSYHHFFIKQSYLIYSPKWSAIEMSDDRSFLPYEILFKNEAWRINGSKIRTDIQA